MSKRNDLTKSQMAILKRCWWRFKDLVEKEERKTIGVERVFEHARLRYRFLLTLPDEIIEMDPTALGCICNNLRKASKLSASEKTKAENYGKRGPRKSADGLF